MKLIAPSILSADFSDLGNEVASVQDAGADWIHIDVMDGHFVPNITMGPVVVKAVKRSTTLPIDVHLMVENPDSCILDFIKAGATLISVHAEACVHLNRTVERIKSSGALVGVALNPATPLSSIEWVLENIDVVLIMSVNPGFGGQNFIQNSFNKIKALRKIVQSTKSSAMIEIDGGVREDNIKAISDAGVDVFVAGSAIFESKNYQGTISALKHKIGA